MTKNEDVSRIPKPVGCSLKRFTTDELVAELKTRHELCPVLDEMTRDPMCLFVTTTESLVKELSKRDNVTKYPRWVTSEEVFGHRQTLDGKYTMLVVRE